MGILIFLLGCFFGAVVTIFMYAMIIAGSEERAKKHEAKRKKPD